MSGFQEESSPEFVTVAEAARALGLSERQVRRYAGRLVESDRLPAHSVRPGDRPTPDAMTGPSPARVRLSALALLAGKVIVEGNARDEASGPLPEVTGPCPAYAGHDDRPPSESVRPVSEDLAILREQLASVTAERDGLTLRLADTQAERDRWQEQAREALEVARAAQDQERAGRLLGSSRAPVQIEASAEGSNLRSGLTESPQAQESGIGGGIAPPSQTEEPRRKFWSWLRRVW